MSCRRSSRFWGLGCPKIFHEIEDSLDLPQGLLERLLERPALTATQCRDYFEAYAADPGRFVDPPTTSPSPTGHGDQLSGYAAVLPSAQEVPHDLH